MPHHDLYPAELRPLLEVEGKGPAWLNEMSEQTLGYPALLITTPAETRTLVARIERLAQNETSDKPSEKSEKVARTNQENVT